METFDKTPKEKGNLSEEEVYSLALERLARIFKVKKEGLRPEMIFGKDLKEPPKRLFIPFSRGKLTDVSEDVNFITTVVFRKNKNFFGDMDIEKIYAQTVDEYCKHMVRCYQAVPDLVESTLDINGN